MIGYTCKYTPTELFAGFGENCVLLSCEAENFEYSGSVTHSNFCSHAKALLEEVKDNSVRDVILVNCCDSIRRVYDVLKDSGGFVYLIDLPHDNGECAVTRLKNELARLIEAYTEYSGKEFSVQSFFQPFKPAENTPDEYYIGVTGARAGEAFLKSVSDAMPYKTVDMTCSGNRAVKAPERADSLDEILLGYAHALLSQLPCMRMTDTGARRQIFSDENCRGIIYHTVKFCDYYDFDYRNTVKNATVPVLKIETDFTTQASGQLSTRFEGFAEGLDAKKSTVTAQAKRGGKYYIGIDSGSTTTNLIALDKDGKIAASSIVRTGANAAAGAKKALESAGIHEDELIYTVATGYGRKNITFSDDGITEITCHAKGARFLNPDCDTIIDIGGQDSKIIRLNKDGSVKSFSMNDKCAAGTGRFLENMSKVLEISLDEMAVLGLDYKKDITISSMCTVFAESEVVSLIADNNPVQDIIHGLNKSVAAKTKTMLGQVNENVKLIMTGGVARNRGVVSELEKATGMEINVPESPDLCGALGAALFAFKKHQ